MITKEAIEAAIRGGWNPLEEYDASTLRITDSFIKGNLVAIHSRTTWSDGVVDTDVTDIPLHKIAFDPSFWRSLGKALGWGVEKQENIGGGVTARWTTKSPQEHYREFCDHIYLGRNPQDFWKRLSK